jgi:methionine synthase I (cobalamin-dependent)
MGDLRARLLEGPCLLLDGGMGSMLLARGLARGDAPERMNRTAPDSVTEVHAEYVGAGCDAVQTNTFGGHPARLQHFDLAGHCAEINARAVALARQAGPAFVIGDMGPTGEYLPPVGGGDRDRWLEGFRLQAGALLEAGADGIHVETMSDVREAETALEAVRDLSSTVPVLVSLTFERKKRGFFTVMGNPPVDSLRGLAAAGATAVGTNCSIASADMRDLGTELLSALDARLVFQPNAGQPRVAADGIHYDQAPEEYAADLLPLIEGGAAAVGGCCGTDPRYLEALAAMRSRKVP